MKQSSGKAPQSHSSILITGATGFLGKELLELLISKGEKGRLRVLTTSAPEWLSKMDVEIVEGSITSREICDVAVDGVDRIYHLAGKVSRNPDDQRSMYSIHVDGTRHLCEAAKKAGVKRIVMASSSGTIAITDDGFEVPDETFPPPIEIIAKFPYYASKLYQEKTARSVCGRDVDLVILNPSLLLGPGDDRLSSTQDVLKFLAGEIPAIPCGGINFVDVRDAAPAFYSAMKKGGSGQSYLVGGPNWTMERFFKQLGRVSQVSAPRIRINKKLHNVTSKLIEHVYDAIGKEPPVEPQSMEMSRYFWYADSTKAKEELGFDPRDPSETLHDTVQYLRQHFLGNQIFS
jgi:nucleoside-diphosphate-sugar epimerase